MVKVLKYLTILFLFLFFFNLSFATPQTIYQASSGKNIYFDLSDSNYVLFRAPASFPYTFSNYHLVAPGTNWNWLTSDTCQVSISGNNVNANWNSHSAVSDVVGFLESQGRTDILDKNLNMKTKLIFELKNSSGVIIDSYTDIVKIKTSGNSFSTTFNQNYVENNFPNMYGSFTVNLKTQPIDGKCLNSGISSSIIDNFNIAQPSCIAQQSFRSNRNVEVNAPSLPYEAFAFLRLVKVGNNGVYSEIFVFPNNLVLDGNDKIDLTTGNSQKFRDLFKGAVDDYDNNNGLDDVIFYDEEIYGSYARGNGIVHTNVFETSNFNYDTEMPYVQINNGLQVLDYDIESLRDALEDQGQDFGDYEIESYVLPLSTTCDVNDFDLIQDTSPMSILLRNPDQADKHCIRDGDYELISGSGTYFNQGTQQITFSCGHCNGFYIYDISSGSRVLVNSTTSSSGGINFAHDLDLNGPDQITLELEEYEIQGSQYRPKGTYILRKGCSDFEKIDDEKFKKAKCNKNQTICKLIDTDEDLILPSLQNKTNIKIYKQGQLIREERPNPVTIALRGHKIKKYKNKNQANEFIEQTVRLMEKFNISKYIDYNASTDETKITLELSDIPESEQNDITIYQVIPKEFANKLNEIEVTTDNGQFIVLDKDPVIGWYFNDSDNNETVEYILPGDNEGGTIIITQEPILFNEGELVVNYREANCNAGELELFQLDDLENSNVYVPNSGKLFKVCLAHVNDTISNSLQLSYIENKTGHVFNYTSGSLMFIDGDASTSLDISTNLDSIYWNVQYSQDNPDGTFSCLGSYNLQNGSTFGDCGYTSNRIWLHLGDDMEPPETKIVYPYLAHTMRIRFEATDNYGSGVNETYYCIEEVDGAGCTPKLYDGKEIFLKCASSWGCVKTINYYSTDKQGNIEDLQTYQLTLIEQGSACQSDCTAQPTPNRVIKDCMNLNGCQFYGVTENEQEQVAESCHYLTAGTWVENPLNANEEVMCPNGPTRAAQFTGSQIYFWDSICDNLQQASYPVMIDGKQVNMVFVYCEEYAE